MGFTKNYYQLVAQGMSAVPNENIPADWTLKNVNGGTSVLYGGIFSTNMSGGQVYATSLGAGKDTRVMLGTGTNAFAVDDYTLQTDVSSSFAKVLLDVTASAITEKQGRTLTWVGKYVNNSNADIAVSEIGFTKNMFLPSAGGYTDVLIYREVLAAPVTIHAGEGITVTITFTFDGFNVLASVSAE